MAWFAALLGAAFIAAFSYDFARSPELPRRTSNLLGLLAVALAVLDVTTALDAGIIPAVLFVLALLGHVLARAVTDSTKHLGKS